jgi:ribosomal protein S1
MVAQEGAVTRMDVSLHQEFDARVVGLRPWGLEVEFAHGVRGLIDNTKHGAWASGDPSPAVGATLRVVVLDNQRDPVRLSALDEDLEIARRKRGVVDG